MLLSNIFVLVFTHHVAAHYCFPYFLANEVMHPKWKYVRRALTKDTEERLGTGSFPPLYDLTSEDIRCGRNSTQSGIESDVVEVVAGSKVGFRPDLYPRGWCRNCGSHPNGSQVLFFHDGPFTAYMAKSPQQTKSGLQTWDGAGDFFKIAERGPDSERGWWTTWTYNFDTLLSEWNLTIPAKTPPGFYLLRVESVLVATSAKPQFYVSCAQVEVKGEGGGTEPGPTVKFPGAYDYSHPGITVSSEVKQNWTKYEIPGPKVWSG